MTDDIIPIKRYRLTLSVWRDLGEDTIELREQRRTAQCIVSPMIDPPEDFEKVLIRELCEKIMEAEQ